MESNLKSKKSSLTNELDSLYVELNSYVGNGTKQTLSVLTDETTLQTETTSYEISTLDKSIGALICNDVGSRSYNNVFTDILNQLEKNSYAELSDDEKENFLSLFQEQLETATDCNGYEIVVCRLGFNPTETIEIEEKRVA